MKSYKKTGQDRERRLVVIGKAHFEYRMWNMRNDKQLQSNVHNAMSADSRCFLKK